MIKICLICLIALILVPTVVAGSLTIEGTKLPYFLSNQGDIKFYFHVFNSTDAVVSPPTATCNFEVKNQNGSILLQQIATNESLNYVVTLGSNITASVGVYQYTVWCSNSESGFLSDYFYIGSARESEVGGFPLAALILVPILFGILLLLGSFMFGEDHAVLKIGLFLIAYLTIFISLWFGIQTVVAYYGGFPAIQDSISTMVWVVGVLFFVIVSYFLIYAFIQGVEAAAQKKRKEMEY